MPDCVEASPRAFKLKDSTWKPDCVCLGCSYGWALKCKNAMRMPDFFLVAFNRHVSLQRGPCLPMCLFCM